MEFYCLISEKSEAFRDCRPQRDAKRGSLVSVRHYDTLIDFEICCDGHLIQHQQATKLVNESKELVGRGWMRLLKLWSPFKRIQKTLKVPQCCFFSRLPFSCHMTYEHVKGQFKTD